MKEYTGLTGKPGRITPGGPGSPGSDSPAPEPDYAAAISGVSGIRAYGLYLQLNYTIYFLNKLNFQTC